MRIKKFNELFDSGEIKDLVFSSDPSAEIDYLSKNLKKYTKIDYKPNEKTIETLLLKIINYKQPFMSIFLEADKRGGTIETEDIAILVRYDEKEKYHAFILADDRHMVILSIRVNEEDYDVSLSIYDSESPDEIQSFEEKNITFDDVVNIIENEYASTIIEFGFEEVLDYNYIQKIIRYN